MFDKYCQLVDKILLPGNMQVVLLGDKSKIDQAQRLVENLGLSDKKQGLINLVGKTSLIELVAVLKEAAAGIGPDSGPGHLSGAVGTPYIALFGPTSPKRVAPYGCQHLVIKTDVSCAPCNKRRCPGLDKICMSSISVGAVETKLAEALDSRNI
jgi:ADP-heptose:LPS heptosyltransferase